MRFTVLLMEAELARAAGRARARLWDAGEREARQRALNVLGWEWTSAFAVHRDGELSEIIFRIV